MKEKQQQQQEQVEKPKQPSATSCYWREAAAAAETFSTLLDTQQQGCITCWTKNSIKHDQAFLTTVPDLKYLKIDFGVKNLHLRPTFFHYNQ